MNKLKSSCPLCHGGNKQTGTTTFTVELGFGVVVIRKVPAQVCDQCGADWIEDDTAEKLEKGQICLTSITLSNSVPC